MGSPYLRAALLIMCLVAYSRGTEEPRHEE
jgi:hypothetical protein